MNPYKRILVIRLSALGDIILSFPTFAALRKYYPDAEITLLTLQPFGKLLNGCPYFDHVWTISPWSWRHPGKWLAFAKDLRKKKFDCVYDIQRNDRTLMLSFLAPAALRKKWYDRKRGGFHYDPQALVATDISIFPPVDLDWMRGDIDRFNIKAHFILIVPGSAPQHPQKRWPAKHYADLSRRVLAAGYTPVLIGAQAEENVLEEVARDVPDAVNLCGQTSMQDIATLAKSAVAALGNDTGPMHLISAVGCPVISLFSFTSNPEQSAPRGTHVSILRAQNIADISVHEVFLCLEKMIKGSVR